MPCLFPLVSNYRTSSPTATSLTVLTPGQTRQLTAPAHDWLTTSDRTCPHPTSNFIIWPRISTGIYIRSLRVNTGWPTARPTALINSSLLQPLAHQKSVRPSRPSATLKASPPYPQDGQEPRQDRG